jgi:hypothetical protein
MLLIYSLVNFGVGGLSSFLSALAKSFFIRSSCSAKILANALGASYFFSGNGGLGAFDSIGGLFKKLVLL